MDDVTGFKTGTGQIHDLIELLPDFGLPDVFKFSQIMGPNGQASLLFEDQYRVWLAPRRPKPPRIQLYLQQAHGLRKRLDKTPGLTQTALAKELGSSRFELIHNLNLLKLAPGIQKFLMSLKPSHRECPITKKSLQRISTIKDPDEQKQQFNHLVASVAQ